jgi:DNA helicase-2/ATP-dependent DNA helicase PcrA
VRTDNEPLPVADDPEGSHGTNAAATEPPAGLDAEEPVGRVEVATFHRAKGLEWAAVALVGLESGMVPIAYAATSEALDEERRLLYVAVTRAELELWCSWARQRTRGGRSWLCDPSPFVADLERATAATATALDQRSIGTRIEQLRAQLAVS